MTDDQVWGRNNSSNVQKAMWAIGEIGIPHERIDVGGAFGQNNEPKYLAMNPNGLVPTLEEEDGFTLWESNSVVRYLAGKYDKNNVIEPKDAKTRARASMWMDWQLTTAGPAITPVFWGLVRTPPEKRDMAAIKAGQEKSVTAFKMLDEQLGKTQYVAGNSFSYGDIPVGIMCYRHVTLITERPPTPHLDRWYAAISKRKPFQDHVGSIKLT